MKKLVAAADINNYINGTSGGLGQYIYLQQNYTLENYEITLSRDVYICLNGYHLSGVIREST